MATQRSNDWPTTETELKQQETPPPEAEQRDDGTTESDIDEYQSNEEETQGLPTATSNKQAPKTSSQPVIALSVQPGMDEEDEEDESGPDDENGRQNPSNPSKSAQPKASPSGNPHTANSREERHSQPGHPIEMLYSCDPITGKEGEVKAEVYCTTHGTIALHLPPLHGDRRRLIFQPVSSEELKDKKKQYKQHIKDSGGRDIGGMKATKRKDLEDLSKF